MTIQEWLTTATKQLEAANIDTARLDALVLLADCLNTNKAQLLANPNQSLTNEQEKHLNELLDRRALHEPLAYIRETVEFYGRDFAVNKHILVPRPETETMIELVKQLKPKAVIDVGTGSGAIAITVACELHEVQVIATDIDPACLEVARQNSVKHQATIDLKETDLLEDIKIPEGAAILANLPYVPNDHKINQAATLEPKLAIFGGEDGLDLYRRMFTQLKGHKVHVLTEALPSQHKELTRIASVNDFKLLATDDFIQVFLAG